ncbi:nucleoid-associated protein [Plebeiibacterium sediminum]|uniref:Nucleoid-associated protein n=1 Tax=Plebeiibacterium sediminum TaxID=2992112 RepID=A0AAE3SHH4_9BACT|nr:nucleoid-associated protein [Plebeiobacterium sediminum]MCW3789272.1 nucleoid-associated protein [Plebeiobacterium sediminum]
MSDTNNPNGFVQKLKVNKIIVHQIITEMHSSHVELESSNSLMKLSEKEETLVNELNKRYKKHSTLTYAIFDDNPQPKDFQFLLDNYLDSFDDEDFISFSNKSIEILKKDLESKSASKGGYFVFVDYEIRDRFIGIFLIRNTNGQILKKINDTFQVDELMHIDFEKLAFGCRINLKSYQNEESKDRYLAFVQNKGDSTSKYFSEWIAIKNEQNNKVDSEKLMDICTKIEVPNDEKGNQMRRDDFMKNVSEYCSNLKGQNLNLWDLGRRFYPDDEYKIINYVDNNNIEINRNFKPVISVLNKFLNIDAEAENIKIKFPKKYYKSKKVELNKDKTSVIIHSTELAKKILQEQSKDEN